MKKIIDFLKKYNIEFYENFNLSKISSMKIGEESCLLIYPQTTDEFKKILKLYFYYIKTPYYFKLIVGRYIKFNALY